MIQDVFYRKLTSGLCIGNQMENWLSQKELKGK